jgi:hypothetical protein
MEATMKRSRLVGSVMSLILAGSTLVHARDWFVDQKHPSACDTNAGVEPSPFKTIQAAVDAAQPGDTVWVKLGDYQEQVWIRTSGTMDRPITLSAWKDDRVRIGYPPRPLPADGQWKPIAGSKSFQIKLTQEVPDDFLVLLDGKPIVTWTKNAPPADDKVNQATYRKADRTLMFNANGKDPATQGRFAYGRRPAGDVEYSFFHVENTASWWVIRRLEFSWQNQGLRMFGNNCTVEDCFFYKCYGGGLGLHGRTDIVRRCNFYRCGTAIGASGTGPAHLLEENLIVDCGQRNEDNILIVDLPDALMSEMGGGPTCFKGCNLGMNFVYNIVADNPHGCGWYADCANVQSCRLMGNAFWDNPGGGMYNEASVHDTLTLGNCFYRNKAFSSVCARWSVIDNLFFEAGVEWYNMDLNPICDAFNLLRRNAFVAPGYGYLSDYGQGWGQMAFPEVFHGCVVDYNRVWAPPDAVLINDGGEGKKYKTLEDIRKEFTWETHGQVLPYDEKQHTAEAAAEAMGGSVVTFRLPWGEHSGEARPMLASRHGVCHWPGAAVSANTGDEPNFFWHVGDGNDDPTALWNGYAPFAYQQFRQPISCGEQLGQNHGCRWYLDAEPKYRGNLGEKISKSNRPWLDKMMRATSNPWLVMEGLDPAKMLPQGVGYWSPLLAAAEGAKITVSMRISGKNIVSTDKGSPAIWLDFRNETGQHRQRVFIIGKDDQGKMHHAEFAKDSYDWTELKETVVAPKDAIRMSLFFGILPCQGRVDFDDIDIKTATEAGSVAQQILAPRLPLKRIRESFIVDLSEAANRALADDVDDDGKGGWTDQGGGADMQALATGKRDFGGVTFNILPGPKSVVVLKSSSRKPGDLPENVSIPVGRKLDTIFFLHAAAWVGGKECFHYVLHYADGKDVMLSVDLTNLADWIAAPVVRFPNETGTFTTVAETVKVPQFSQGSIYRMEWSAPVDRRQVEIKSIEFVGNGKSVPVLLGITGVMEW